MAEEWSLGNIDYTQRKFFEAVQALMGYASMEQRLFGAGLHLLTLQAVRHEERAFPGHPDLQARFERVMEDLTSGGSIEMTAAALGELEARRIASEIFSLFCRATDLASNPVGFEPRWHAEE